MSERYWPDGIPVGQITVKYRFNQNACWEGVTSDNVRTLYYILVVLAFPASILFKSILDRYRPDRISVGQITVRYILSRILLGHSPFCRTPREETSNNRKRNNGERL